MQSEKKRPCEEEEPASSPPVKKVTMNLGPRTESTKQVVLLYLLGEDPSTTTYLFKMYRKSLSKADMDDLDSHVGLVDFEANDLAPIFKRLAVVYNDVSGEEPSPDIVLYDKPYKNPLEKNEVAVWSAMRSMDV
jgi:hypothetical protein